MLWACRWLVARFGAEVWVSDLLGMVLEWNRSQRKILLTADEWS